MIADLPPEAFARLLAELWQQRGWQTAVRERSGGAYVVRGRHPSGSTGLLYVRPGADRTVSREVFDSFRRVAREQQVDVPVLATQGHLSEEVVTAATDAGVHLLDPPRIETVVEKGGFESVVQRVARAAGGNPSAGGERQSPTDGNQSGAGGTAHADGGTAVEGDSAFARVLGPAVAAFGTAVERVPGGAAVGSRLPNPLEALSRLPLPGSSPPPLDPLSPEKGADGRLAGLRPSLNRKTLLTAVLVLAVLVAGTLGAGTLARTVVPGNASAGGADVGVSAVSTAAPEEADLLVRWTASRSPTVTLANGTQYRAPANETFVVVQLNVTSTADEPSTFSQSALRYETDGRRYAVQPLVGTDGGFAGGLFAPGEQRTVWVAFSVPADAASGTLQVRRGSDAARVGVAFRYDESMTVTVVGS